MKNSIIIFQKYNLFHYMTILSKHNLTWLASWDNNGGGQFIFRVTDSSTSDTTLGQTIQKDRMHTTKYK
jgi:hypothetical protein